MTGNKGRTNARTLTFKQKYSVLRYIEDNTHDGKINLWPKELADTAGKFLSMNIAPNTIKKMCDDMGVKLKTPIHGGARTMSAMKMMEERVADLEEDVAKLDDQLTEMNAQVKYLIEGLCSKKERDGINGAHQPLLDEAIGRPS